jgi:hypothetical protein
MGGSCGCGTEVAYAFHRLACLDCGAPCCPACAVHLESVSYCQGCATSILGSGTVQASGPYDLH